MKNKNVFYAISVFVLFVLFVFIVAFSLFRKPNHIISDCSIFDSNGNLIKKYSDGFACIFLDDGSFIVHDENSLKRVDSVGKILWEHKGEYHHQITLLSNKTNFLALSNADDDHLDRTARHGQIEYWSTEGQRLKTWTIKNQIEYFFHWLQQPVLKSKPFDGPYKFEYEHINAAQEIPRNNLEKHDPAFKAGNILISINYRSSLLIFDRDLLKPIKLIPLPKTITNFHDAQLLSSGEILLYINAEASNDPRLLIKFHPLTKEESTILTHREAGSDQPAIFGGVQLLPDNTYLLNIQKNNIWSLGIYSTRDGFVQIKSSEALFGYAQQYKFENVSQFLKRNKSL